jgi:hypothetical protein
LPKQRKSVSRKRGENMRETHEDSLLSRLMSPNALQLLPGSGAGLIKQIGFDVIRGIILDVLTGKNIRDSTEELTRRRISALNMAMTALFLKGAAQSSDFVDNLPVVAADILARGRVPRSERWLAQWMLGLTDKGVQNILRDDRTAFKNYSDLYMQVCREIIDTYRKEYGELTGYLKLGEGNEIIVDWLFITYLLNAIGAQTLTVRGSGKSAMGKLFEKLILGSLLSILGFKYESSGQIGDGIFWLSTRDTHRESDATLLYEIGKGVRFDIGFIGRGNTEISLDKVTRYQQQQVLQNKPFFMVTIIIVDRIGERSNIIELARKVNGRIVQMSASYWPQQVARLLNEHFGFEHELIDMEQNRIDDYLRERLELVPLESFIGSIPVENPAEVRQMSLLTEDEGVSEEEPVEPDDEDV